MSDEATFDRHETGATDSGARVEALLAVTRQLALEMHPHKAGMLEVKLDSTLEGDVGLDSLGRVELLLRLEKNFNVHLPEQLLANAESPRDLLRALEGARERDSTAQNHWLNEPKSGLPGWSDRPRHPWAH